MSDPITTSTPTNIPLTNHPNVNLPISVSPVASALVQDDMGAPLPFHSGNVTSDGKPLGLHVPLSMKQKVWNSEFIDLGQLLEPDHPSAISQANTATQQVLFAEGKLLVQPFFKSKRISTIETWTTAFTTYMSIFLEKHGERARELLQYMDGIRKTERQFGGQGWYDYDVSFRREQAYKPNRSWGTIDHTYYLTKLCTPFYTLHPVGNIRSTGSTQQAKSSDGFRNFRSSNPCFAYNKGRCQENPCKYAHKCTKCQGFNHPAFKCFK